MAAVVFIVLVVELVTVSKSSLVEYFSVLGA